ncbi:DUF2397 family protein [Streptomyces shenzhenensis]|uniref:DUF2397 family protein n=1 Tax=Streptomyces shenzhenensis TaxID=943815 RepID=UPI0028683388|nr:DUF2397 family protein [Streptomyces shenzhenensis]
MSLAFPAAKERFAVHPRPGDVYAALDGGSRPADLEAVTQALDKLVECGNLPDPAKTYVALSVLMARFTDLADNARAFMGSLQRTIDLHDIEVEAFLAYKDRERSRDAPCGIARRPEAFGPGRKPQRTFTARSHSFGPARGLVVRCGLVDPARWSAPAAGTVRFATVAAPPVSASSSVSTSPWPRPPRPPDSGPGPVPVTGRVPPGKRRHFAVAEVGFGAWDTGARAVGGTDEKGFTVVPADARARPGVRHRWTLPEAGGGSGSGLRPSAIG